MYIARQTKQSTTMRLPTLLLLTALTSALGTQQTKAQTEQQVADKIEAHWGLLNAGNSAGFAANFATEGFSAASSDGSFWDYSVQSADDAEAQTAGVDFDLHPHHVTVTMLTKDIALATYYLVGSITPSEGEGITNYRTRASQIWVKEGSAWKIKHEHFSALFGGAGVGG
jgi:hypothetical protein